jgi:guanosine-3',5'-bis(diphosphate) 3'-pyrophosphohydrolase
MLVQRAEGFAKLVHRNQFYGQLSYYIHLKEVYSTLLDFGITDEIVLAASWLHGSMEDTEITYETLEIQFGKEVADLVLAVTNEKGASRGEILEKTATKLIENEKALLIKLADRVVNTEQSLDNNEKLYEMYKKEFPRFREFLYDDKSITYPIIYLWYYLENLYQNEEDRLNLNEIENIAQDIYFNNLDEREAEYSKNKNLQVR